MTPDAFKTALAKLDMLAQNHPEWGDRETLRTIVTLFRMLTPADPKPAPAPAPALAPPSRPSEARPAPTPAKRQDPKEK